MSGKERATSRGLRLLPFLLSFSSVPLSLFISVFLSPLYFILSSSLSLSLFHSFFLPPSLSLYSILSSTLSLFVFIFLSLSLFFNLSCSLFILHSLFLARFFFSMGDPTNFFSSFLFYFLLPSCRKMSLMKLKSHSFSNVA
jgi:hypothetical protein